MDDPSLPNKKDPPPGGPPPIGDPKPNDRSLTIRLQSATLHYRHENNALLEVAASSAIERNVAPAAHTMLSDERPCANYNRDAGQNYSGGDCGRGPLPGATPCPGGTPPQPRGGGGYGPGP